MKDLIPNLLHNKDVHIQFYGLDFLFDIIYNYIQASSKFNHRKAPILDLIKDRYVCSTTITHSIVIDLWYNQIDIVIPSRYLADY